MNRHAIGQRDDTKIPSVEFGHFRPESEAILLLRFDPNWLLDRANTPFLLEIGSLPKHFVLEVVREPVCGLSITEGSRWEPDPSAETAQNAGWGRPWLGGVATGRRGQGLTA